MSSNKVKTKDLGWNKIKKELMHIPYEVAVGIQGEEALKDRDGVTNVMLGTIHEFGSSNGDIPQRSFLRYTINKNGKKYQKDFEKIIKAVLEGKNLKGELVLLSEAVRFDVIKTIKEHIPPPLEPETIRKKKGETTPLINTGQLWNSISGVVLDK